MDVVRGCSKRIKMDHVGNKLSIEIIVVFKFCYLDINKRIMILFVYRDRKIHLKHIKEIVTMLSRYIFLVIPKSLGMLSV